MKNAECRNKNEAFTFRTFSACIPICPIFGTVCPINKIPGRHGRNAVHFIGKSDLPRFWKCGAMIALQGGDVIVFRFPL
jgi:hypothetical protein